MDFAKQHQRILSLCAGMRGLERGIERAGINLAIASYVEIEAFIIWNLVKQMEQGVLAPAPVWTNLKTFPWEKFHGRIHGIIGGYPCQPFSVAGKQAGTADPRHLWPYIKEGIHSVRPLWCFFENVPGHINIGYREVRSDLEGIGYTVKEGIFSAEEVGAPHQRKRLFILAVRKGFDQVNSSCWMSGGIQDEISKREGYGTTRTSGILDDTGCNGSEPYNQISTGRNSAELASEELGNANDIRLWREGNKEQSPEQLNKNDKWPARPGQEQHEWEEPRIKSRMGFTINGYNYREDLLRMAGNGVVEQTAELAWRELWNKTINH